MTEMALQMVDDSAITQSRSLIAIIFDQRPLTSPRRWAVVIAIGLSLHIVLYSLGRTAATPRTLVERPMEVILSPPPRIVLPSPPPPKSEVQPRPSASPSKSREIYSRPAAQRAKAGRVVALAPKAEPSAEEAAESIVTGDADSYAGGITTASGESNKAVETMPPVEKPLLPKPAPKVDTVAITRAYLREIRDELSRAKRYPVSAQRLGLQGVVIVAFVIDDAGSFTAITVKRSSGSDLLDRAAVETVKELSRKISRPKETGKLSLPLETALRFEILQ